MPHAVDVRWCEMSLSRYLISMSTNNNLNTKMRRCRAISKENKDFKQTVEDQAKMIESQKFVMNNLRNGIDYLKTSCKGQIRAGATKSRIMLAPEPHNPLLIAECCTKHL
jgi:hypothetical protein